jgi:Ca-activated chloride channel family protein
MGRGLAVRIWVMGFVAAGTSGCAAVAGGLLLGGGVAAGRLSMKPALTQQMLVQGSDGHLGLVVGIEAMEIHGPRPPLNAPLVLDRSGSMSGYKLRHAKAAARQFIRAMRPGDRIALVTYGDEPELALPSTELTEDSRQRALEAVERVTASGMTHLSGGILLGRDQILEHRGAGRVNRVILLSDGIANVGTCDPVGLARLAEDLRERDISLTTMGVGLDFNEDVMMRLAERGGGNYYYIREAQGLASVFREELGSLFGIVARRPELRLLLAPGVRLRSVPGYRIDQNGQEVRVRLSDISGGSRRKVVLSLEAPTGQPGSLPVADISLEYREPAGGRQTLRSRVAAQVTSDPVLAERSVNRVALGEATKAEAALVIQRAVSLYEQGDAAGASRTLRAASNRIQKRARAYRFNDDLVQGQLRGALGGILAAPAPKAEPGNHLRKEMKRGALELAH